MRTVSPTPVRRKTWVSLRIFYLLTHGFSTLGAFAGVSLIRGADDETAALPRWAGDVIRKFTFRQFTTVGSCAQ